MRPRQISDDDLLLCAREVFLEHGPSASTTLIAERVGLSQAALFKRFGTKRELLLRALRPPNPPAHMDRLAAGPTAGPLAPQLVELGVALIGELRRIVPGVLALASSGVCAPQELWLDGEPPPVRLHRALTAWFDRGADRLQAHADAAMVAQAFMGSIHVYAMFEAMGHPPEHDAEQYVRHLVDSLSQGVIRP